ncbi:DUF6087 family protein [Streptomyces sp. RGM 3693]|uniref:DUF6087 family protein n=1 Tax=Streptomyces sp. RGM 3693 TaxID=3413284 RepID=UPI003D275730
MDDEPLSEWAERRDAKIGRLRAVPIFFGDGPKGSHLNPGAPRVIERWNGSGWEVFTVAANLNEARKLLRPADAESPAQEPAQPARPPLAPGRGKHRKPR